MRHLISFLVLFGTAVLVGNAARVALSKQRDDEDADSKEAEDNGPGCDIPSSEGAQLDLSRSHYMINGLSQMVATMPPFVNFLNASARFDFLEIGCGTGKAILELQARFPDATCICANRRGYGPEQVNDQKSLVYAAEHYKVPIRCRSNGRVALPDVFMVEAVHYRQLPFPTSEFDVIVSHHHSMNQGKMHPYHSQILVPRISRLLDYGGYASLMLLYNCAGQILGDDSLSGTAAGRGVNDRFKLLKMTRSISTTTQGGTVSLTFTFALYVSHNSVGLFIQRCSRERAADPHPFWGCIVVSDPHSIAPISKHEESLTKYKAVLKKLPPPVAMEKSKDWTLLDDPVNRDPPYDYNTEDKKEIIRYGKDYLSNVVYFLDKPVLNPGMLFI